MRPRTAKGIFVITRAHKRPTMRKVPTPQSHDIRDHTVNMLKNLATCAHMQQNISKCKDLWPLRENPVCPEPVWKRVTPWRGELGCPLRHELAGDVRVALGLGAGGEATSVRRSLDTGVCEKNTPPDQRTPGRISLKNTKSGCEEHFMLLFFAGQRIHPL